MRVPADVGNVVRHVHPSLPDPDLRPCGDDVPLAVMERVRARKRLACRCNEHPQGGKYRTILTSRIPWKSVSGPGGDALDLRLDMGMFVAFAVATGGYLPVNVGVDEDR